MIIMRTRYDKTKWKRSRNMKKRVMAVLLGITMVATLLTGCGNKGAESKDDAASVSNTVDGSDTKDDSETTDDSEIPSDASADDMIQVVEQEGEKGDKISNVAYVPMATSNELFLTMANDYIAALQAAGFTAEYTSPEFDPAAQLEIFENYVTQGFDCIIVFPINAASMNDAVNEAREKGIKVICQVNATDECDGWVGSSGVDMGKGTCQVSADWVEKQFADAGKGDVKCAVVTTRTDDNNSAISDELEKITDYSDKIEVVKVVETTDTSIEAGQSLAENLYMTNPEVNLVIVEESDVAVGMNTYYAGVDSPLTDKSTFGIFCNNGGTTTYDLIANSQDNSELLRGISSVAPMKYGAQMVANIAIRLSNGEEGDKNFEADPVYLVTPDNVAAFVEANQ